jgi:predicted NAD/FAD-dependent oxidoreductase
MNKEEFGNLVEDTLDKMQQEGLVATVADAKWYVTLGDGTFVVLDQRPYIFLATDEQIAKFDAEGGNAPIDCTDDAHGAFLAHAHIVDEMIDEDL